MSTMENLTKNIVNDWVWCTKYKGTRKLDFEPSDDVFFDLDIICSDNPSEGWDILKNIWIKIESEKIPIEDDFFIGPMYSLAFIANDDVHEEIVNFSKTNVAFLNNMREYFCERDQIYVKLFH